MNKFWKTYFRNLLLILTLFGVLTIFLAIFYPGTFGFFGFSGQFFGALGLGPMLIFFIIAMILIGAIPRTRR